jgi:hypothetical protein
MMMMMMMMIVVMVVAVTMLACYGVFTLVNKTPNTRPSVSLPH